MKVSVSWLKEYVAVEMDMHALADALTMAGLEVESVSDRYDYLDDVVCGKVTDMRSHPNAKDLTICDVDTGKDRLSIVCGAPNIEKNIMVPVALPGTRFPEGTVLEKKSIKGVASDGMVCSEFELGLGLNKEGIMVLDNRAKPGQNLATLLNLSDAVLDIDLTPNRSDCLSVLGIAREIAALQHTHVRYPDIHLPKAEGNISEKTSITVDVPDHCPRYVARMLENVTIAPSPFWLQDRLIAIGLRPVNNVVDVTNFVMMETGQPLHAFDFDELSQHKIHVRMAHPNEPFTTLDQKNHILSPEMLMICDGEKPVALAGVMGGLNSEVKQATNAILIESAYFNPVTIRKTVKKLGLPSEASHRFERGVDPQGTINAVNRAVQLMVEIGAGTLVEGIIDVYPRPGGPKTVTLDIEKTNRLLGTDLRQDEMKHLLTSIEFEVKETGNNSLTVIPPSFRVDIQRPVDLMEEVARLWGYNHIPTTYPLIPAKAKSPDTRLYRRDRIKNTICALGFSEAITYSFISRQSCDLLHLHDGDRLCNTVPVLNPLSETQGVMRTSLIPGLLETVRYNIAQRIKDVKLFEIGNIFIQKALDTQPEEIEMAVGLWTGVRTVRSWLGPQQACDFYDIKGAVEGIFEGLDLQQVTFTRESIDRCPYTKPGHTAQINIKGNRIGLIGEIHPSVLENYDVHQKVFIFEMNLDLLIPHIPDNIQFSMISSYPAITRDVTLILDRGVEAQAILNHVSQLNESLVESLSIFDIFEGDSIPESKKSISFRVTYRSPSETLEDERVNHIHRSLIETLLSAFDATFPS